jgi:anaerobic ribonucleoside-triphosphate reductase activating protein
MSEPPRSDPSWVEVARIVDQTRAEGPGLRTAVWVQGCTIRCPGCFNPHLWTFRGGTRYRPEEIVDRVVAAGAQGITLLGGEPFDHAAGLAVVAAGVQAAGLSVMTFSGYTTQQLTAAIAAGRPDLAALLDHTDLLVAGPFVADRIDTRRPWVGSTNQEFVALTHRLRSSLDRLDATLDRVEVTVDASGAIAVNGWAEVDALDRLLAAPATRWRSPRSR